jgi:hypothetical protein
MLSTLLELVGLALVVVAAFLIAPTLGFAVAGAALVLVGWWLER